MIADLSGLSAAVVVGIDHDGHVKVLGDPSLREDLAAVTTTLLVALQAWLISGLPQE